MRFDTKRVMVIPFTAERMKQAIHDKEKLAESLHIHIPDDWPHPDLVEALPIVYEKTRLQSNEMVWNALAIDRETNSLIGDVGFKGGPDASGAVDIGYSIVPAYQGRGYATEIAQAAVDWVKRQPGVKQITAKCDMENKASVRVLEKSGFVRVGQDGIWLKWMWKKAKRNE
jgi:ribosomal-protein-alanine N-acetyltransferase